MKNWQVAGIHSVKEALVRRPKAVSFVALKEPQPKQAELQEILKLCKKNRIEVRHWNDKKLSTWTSVHQGVAAEVRPIAEVQLDQLANKEKSLIVVLDGIEDPHNLGAILRSSWLLEADAVLLPKDRSARLNSTALKIACGGAEHVPVSHVTNLARSLDELKESGFWIYGLAEGGDCNLFQWEPDGKCVLIVGAESKGMRKNTRKLCDQIVEIWQTPTGSSFNASVAAALAMNQYRSKFL